MKNRKRYGLAAVCLLVVVVAALLALQGVTVGDDLGYYFADAQLHKGGGERVTGLSQVLTTQLSHFMTFNGRVIVHSLTQWLLMPGMRSVYSLTTGVMFCLVWLGICRCVAFRPGWRMQALCMGLLWWLMPAPGVIWFSLAAFALNYLWPAAAAVWLLVALRRVLDRESDRLWAQLLLALLCGMLQESFALPLLGAVGLMWLITRNRKVLYIGIALAVGTLVLLVAPGNYAHASAGGGFGPAVLLHKTLSMLADTLRTPLPWLSALYAGAALSTKSRRLLRPDRFELLLLLAIGCALLLGVLSYTALRQLVAPSLFAVILIARLLLRLLAGWSLSAKNVGACAATVLTCGLLAGGAIVRAETAARMKQVERMAASGERVVWVDCSRAAYNNPLLGLIAARMDDDPFADELLHIVFDSNTRKGLARVHAPGRRRNVEVIPVSRDSLLRAARRVAVCRTPGVWPVSRLDARYSMLAVPGADTLPDMREVGGKHLRFASVSMGDTLCIIVPGGDERVRIQKLHLRH